MKNILDNIVKRVEKINYPNAQQDLRALLVLFSLENTIQSKKLKDEITIRLSQYQRKN